MNLLSVLNPLRPVTTYTGYVVQGRVNGAWQTVGADRAEIEDAHDDLDALASGEWTRDDLRVAIVEIVNGRVMEPRAMECGE